MKTKLFTVAALFVAAMFTTNTQAQTTLTAGDIAIVGMDADNDECAFMLLKDIDASTKITISNRSWKGSNDGWTGSYGIDDVWTWTSGAAFSVGDIFTLTSNGTVYRVDSGAQTTVGTTVQEVGTDNDFDVVNGESALIYQVYGTFAEPTSGSSTAWICGINRNAGWGANGGGGNRYCQLPTPALTNGTNAVAVSPYLTDNSIYTGTITGGSASGLRNSINTVGNWSTSAAPYRMWSFEDSDGANTGQIGVAGTLNTDSLDAASVNVSPNPVADVANISGADVISATVTSISGATVKTSNGNAIDMSDLASGIYIITVETANGTVSKKIVKE